MKNYMELCLHLDGKENVYLRVPTVYDGNAKKWIAFIKTPESQRLIAGQGETSDDLTDSFNKELGFLIQESEELCKEIIGMFMPGFYYEK